VTYSIVARDRKTGELGVAVQSHYFSVGSAVTWARAGVGAVATQASTETLYGPMGLELMAAGKTASEALSALLRADAKSETRQVAMVDSKGRVATHTGSKCIPQAGHAVGEGMSCQGNIMKSRQVWTQMEHRFEERHDLPLPERLVAALEAGEDAGGDLRGKRSAAILVVAADVKASQWDGRLVDLRVEDHPEPVPELRRLLRYKRGYEWVSKGDDLLTSEKYEEAMRAYRKGIELVPEVLELRYWVGLSMLKTREKAKGIEMLTAVFREDPSWTKLTRGMIRTGVFSVDPHTARKLFVVR
jgi:uncharacterized Ntn-hydrolase superfamily protein